MSLETLQETILSQQILLETFGETIRELMSHNKKMDSKITMISGMCKENLDLIISQKAEIDVLREELAALIKKKN